ncbi:MAG: hypothetical protein QXG56_05915 [Candidatus Bathyarchaeia archaeon]
MAFYNYPFYLFKPFQFFSLKLYVRLGFKPSVEAFFVAAKLHVRLNVKPPPSTLILTGAKTIDLRLQSLRKYLY